MFFAGLHNTWTTDTWSTRLSSPSVDPLNVLTTPPRKKERLMSPWAATYGEYAFALRKTIKLGSR